jgi:hypothetical protein
MYPSWLDRRVTSPQTDDEFAARAAEELLSHVLREGFEQGCILPIAARRFIIASDEAAQQLASGWERLGREAYGRILELERAVDPGLSQGDLAGFDGPGFIVLTQQCDLVREPGREPTIEVAAISVQPVTGNLANLRSLRSWREIVVTELGDRAIVADSRVRVLVDKRCLLEFPAVQALPNSGRERRRFAWWAGARYFRRPVPTPLHDAIEKPLRDALKSDDSLLAVADRFLWFIVDAVDPERPRLIGIFEDEAEREGMEESMDTLFEAVSFERLSDEDYDAQAIGQMPAALFLGATSYLLDLEGLSGEGSPEPPYLEP